MIDHADKEFIEYLQPKYGQLDDRDAALLTVYSALPRKHSALFQLYPGPVNDLMRRLLWLTLPEATETLFLERGAEAWLEDCFWLTERYYGYLHQRQDALLNSEFDFHMEFARVTELLKQQQTVLRWGQKEKLKMGHWHQRHNMLCQQFSRLLPSLIRTCYARNLMEPDAGLHQLLMEDLNERGLKPLVEASRSVLDTIRPQHLTRNDLHLMLDIQGSWENLIYLGRHYDKIALSHEEHQTVLAKLLVRYANPKSDTDNDISYRKKLPKEVVGYFNTYVDDALVERLIAMKPAIKRPLPAQILKDTPLSRLSHAKLLGGGWMNPFDAATQVHALDVQKAYLEPQDASAILDLLNLIARHGVPNRLECILLAGHQHPQGMTGDVRSRTLLHWLLQPAQTHLLTTPLDDGRLVVDVVPDWLEEIDETLKLGTEKLNKMLLAQQERIMKQAVVSDRSAHHDQLDYDHTVI